MKALTASLLTALLLSMGAGAQEPSYPNKDSKQGCTRLLPKGGAYPVVLFGQRGLLRGIEGQPPPILYFCPFGK